MLSLKVFLNANTTMRISKKYNLFYSQNDMVTRVAKAFVRIMLVVVQLLRDKIVRFLIKALNLVALLTAIRQIFPDMEPCQILFQNHGMCMSKIWHTRPLHGNEADAKYHFLFAFWDYYA